ncbi:MAG: hypothetical protein JSW04_10300 [Desulfobacterales bacterium]|nr:MAG: hypothetical protein JSW04_10300 [Desulfobacterales bacterium]
MSKRFVIIVGLLLVVALPTSVMAGSHEAKIKKYVDSNIRGWLFAPELLAAVAQQNINHMGLTGDDINNLDQRWRIEKKYHGGGDLMDSKMNNQLSAFLRGVKAASGGVIVEIFVMDNLGLNVGQTDPTGDYMQGDEAKWKKTYPVSAKAVFIDEVEEDGGMNISQTSLTVARPNGARLGAVTIAINVDKL